MSQPREIVDGFSRGLEYRPLRRVGSDRLVGQHKMGAVPAYLRYAADAVLGVSFGEVPGKQITGSPAGLWPQASVEKGCSDLASFGGELLHRQAHLVAIAVGAPNFDQPPPLPPVFIAREGNNL